MKFCDEIVQELYEYISKGYYSKDAATMCGISDSTYYLWLQEGQADKDSGIVTPKSDFLDTIKRAEMKRKQEHIDNIRRAGEEQWQASAWFLERKHKDEYSKTDYHNHNGAMNIKVEFVDDSDE